MADVMKTSNSRSKSKKENRNPISNNEEIHVVKQLVFDEYYNVHTRQYHPATYRFVQDQCVKLKEWADLETSLNLYDFTDSQGYNPDTFYDWCKKFPELSEMHQYAIRRMGSRREMGAMTRKYAEATVHRTLGYYHYIWRQETAALAKLKEDAALSERTVVVIEKFPEVSSRTPEEVAMDIRKATGDKREYGPTGERIKK